MSQPEPTASGIVVVDKPFGWTSHQVVGRLRRLLGTKKVGHAGTLDPMATGVLVVGVNAATRLLGHLALTDKAYTATIRLGQATVTDDAEGDVIEACGASGVTVEAVAAGVATFVGDIQQVPSSVSAIKVNGVRSYARVRAGQDVELAARGVHVAGFDVLATRETEADNRLRVLDVDVAVTCSSGTYIRALARDLGALLGTGGHLTALRRTRVGPFTLDGALAPEVLTDREGEPRRPAVLAMGEVARLCFATRDLDAAQASDVRYGRSLDLPLDVEPTALLHTDDLLALYRPEGGRALPVAVFVTP